VSLKVAIVVGVVIAVLFVGVLALGGSDGEGSAAEETEQDGGILGRLRDRAGDPSLVALEAVNQPCAANTTGLLEFTGGVFATGCTLTVTSDDSGIRILKLSPVSGQFQVEAPAPEGDVEVEDDFAPDVLDPDGDDASVAVGEGVTEVDLTCRDAICQAQIVTS
jgi:hypothetical protein